MHSLLACFSATAVFIGAALLFVVQPMLAKWLLPSFGGSPGTWAACMVFFQGMLLAGYAYAHALSRWLTPRAQLAVHALLVTGALCVAGYSCVLVTPMLSASPVLDIARLLLTQIGATYFVLASTAPLVQRWVASALGREPYALYALSNAGSLLGLLAYPFAVEPLLTLDAQFSLWTQGFAVYAGLMLLLSATLRLSPAPALTQAPRSAAQEPRDTEPVWRERSVWMACAFLPSVMLLAVTNHITIDIAATPLFWIAPLAIYLLTFIAAFSGRVETKPQPAHQQAAIDSLANRVETKDARLRGLALPLWILATIGIGVGSFAQGSASLGQQLGTACLAMLASGLLCHGELARARPSAAHLTEYYLIIAAAGALGSVFVSWLAPVLFDDYYELELSALGSFALLFFTSRSFFTARSRAAWASPQRRVLYLGLGVCVPLLLTSVAMRMQSETAQGSVIERSRSFLGPLRVTDTREGRLLTHGRIRHGMQLRDPALRMQPTMYFGPGTALARVMQEHAIDRPRRIGVVGLGIGTLAAYTKRGDRIRFYELDANVVDVAKRRFSFLRESLGDVEIALGDGRLSLAREPAQRYDILVLDAFSSDSVPVHLLTQEAFAIYLRHLAPDGVLIANTTNRHLAVDRVVRASARAQRLACRVVQTGADRGLHVESARWAVMSRDHGQIAALLRELPALSEEAPEIPFTDARASLLSILR